MRVHLCMWWLKLCGGMLVYVSVAGKKGYGAPGHGCPWSVCVFVKMGGNNEEMSV